MKEKDRIECIQVEVNNCCPSRHRGLCSNIHWPRLLQKDHGAKTFMQGIGGTGVGLYHLGNVLGRRQGLLQISHQRKEAHSTYGTLKKTKNKKNHYLYLKITSKSLFFFLLFFKVVYCQNSMTRNKSVLTSTRLHRLPAAMVTGIKCGDRVHNHLPNTCSPSGQVFMHFLIWNGIPGRFYDKRFLQFNSVNSLTYKTFRIHQHVYNPTFQETSEESREAHF